MVTPYTSPNRRTANPSTGMEAMRIGSSFPHATDRRSGSTNEVLGPHAHDSRSITSGQRIRFIVDENVRKCERFRCLTR